MSGVVRHSVFRHLRERLKSFAEAVGDFQARILLGQMYFLLMWPFALVVRLIRDPLNFDLKRSASFWLPPAETDRNLDKARRQF